MKTSSKLLVAGLALGLIATTARAQELIHVVLNLNFTIQQDSSDDGTTTTTPPPLKFHAGTKQILEQIATDHQTSYPTTASIGFTNGGFVVVDNTGAVLDTIPELTLDTGGDKVSSGSRDDNTGAGTRKSLSIATLSFDDSGDAGNTTPITFTAQGIFSSTRTVSKPDANSNQTESDSATGSFSGIGTVGGKTEIVSGTISGKGKGPLAP